MARSITYGRKELHHIALQHIWVTPRQFLTALQRRVRAFAYPAGVAVAAKTGFKNRSDLLYQREFGISIDVEKTRGSRMLGRFHHESTLHHLGASLDQLIAIFCDMDDFCKAFEPMYARRLLHAGQRQRQRQTTLALSEILTLLVYFHWSHYRTFKHYYTEYVAAHVRPYFPHLVSSQRFVELLPRALVPWCGYLATRKGRCTGMAFMDAT